MATQRVVGAPLPTAVEVTGVLTCVQAQEWAHALWSTEDVLWGCVIAGLTNVGLWRRTISADRRNVRLATTLSARLSRRDRAAVDTQLERLAAFLDAEPVREDWSR